MAPACSWGAPRHGFCNWGAGSTTPSGAGPRGSASTTIWLWPSAPWWTMAGMSPTWTWTCTTATGSRASSTKTTGYSRSASTNPDTTFSRARGTSMNWAAAMPVGCRSTCLWNRSRGPWITSRRSRPSCRRRWRTSRPRCWWSRAGPMPTSTIPWGIWSSPPRPLKPSTGGSSNWRTSTRRAACWSPSAAGTRPGWWPGSGPSWS
ncbi:hypothetical protein GALL_545330 [mine drainage metagenome]|uniref:Uncharacterized protein n=1 Tax=mine drainage metagenome TaxID=410659 RepID=A0A1J5P7Z2_9ZZZZ